MYWLFNTTQGPDQFSVYEYTHYGSVAEFEKETRSWLELATAVQIECFVTWVLRRFVISTLSTYISCDLFLTRV